MTEGEAKVVLGEHMCDKCYSKKCDIQCDYAKAHDVACRVSKCLLYCKCVD